MVLRSFSKVIPARRFSDIMTQAVNARGVYLGCKYAITQMMKQKPLDSGERGWVVNVASIGGQVGLAQERKFTLVSSMLLLLQKV